MSDVRVLVLLPGPDLLAVRARAPSARLASKAGQTQTGIAPAAEDDAEDALAQPPAHLREIDEVRPAADEEGVEAVLA
jgi:hypothetical protein